jgi:hypothetical protein
MSWARRRPNSVVYGLLVLQAGIQQSEEAFTLIAVCIAFLIIAHSSTDVPIARIFHVDDLTGIPDGHGIAAAPTTAVPEQNSKENGNARA